MFWSRRVDDGYTRGGIDVESAINLFFKGVLLFPIFLFAGYVGLMMMKHMIFHGIPVMNQVTPEQREILREKDSQIGLPEAEKPSQVISEDQKVSGAPGVITDHEWQLATLEWQRDEALWREAHRAWVNAPNDMRYDENGKSLHPGQRPSMGDYTEQYQ